MEPVYGEPRYIPLQNQGVFNQTRTLQPPIPVVDGESEKYQADSDRITGTGTKKTAGSTLNPTVQFGPPA